MSKGFWWVALLAGAIALLVSIWYVFGRSQAAPLNASGYSYPSTAGA